MLPHLEDGAQNICCGYRHPICDVQDVAGGRDIQREGCHLQLIAILSSRLRSVTSVSVI